MHYPDFALNNGVIQLVERKDAKKETLYHCKQCTNIYKLKSSLFRHIKTDHCFTKRVKCNICKKTFKTKESLRKHLKNVCKRDKNEDVHCKYNDCEYQCATNSNMKLHYIYIHKEINLMTVICTLCKKKFAQIGQLRKHLKYCNV